MDSLEFHKQQANGGQGFGAWGLWFRVQGLGLDVRRSLGLRM